MSQSAEKHAGVVFVRALLYAGLCAVFAVHYVVTDKVDALILTAWFGVMSKLERMDRP